jgi:tetratricopeptide (TPR) repeat protein
MLKAFFKKIGVGYFKKCGASEDKPLIYPPEIQAIFDKQRRETEKWDKMAAELNQFYPLYEKGRELERLGELEEAIKIYYDILERYFPRGIVYYERPAIILEKMKRYPEAIAICEMAISRIDNIYFHADPEEFQHRIDRMKRKMKIKGQ